MIYTSAIPRDLIAPRSNSSPRTNPDRAGIAHARFRVTRDLLQDSAAELERLRLQARVWEPEADVMLDRIGVQPGWNCVDLGCGGMGVLGPLSKRVGKQGRVVGIENDARQLAAARDFVLQNELANVEISEQDAYRTTLPRESFDLTHVRFVFAPVGRDEELLREMLGLTRPGGVLAIQEPDATSWNCYPAHPAWEQVKSAILAAFASGGGDFDVGQRTYSMLRRSPGPTSTLD